jgi:hypothetical protein
MLGFDFGGAGRGGGHGRLGYRCASQQQGGGQVKGFGHEEKNGEEASLE